MAHVNAVNSPCPKNVETLHTNFHNDETSIEKLARLISTHLSPFKSGKYELFPSSQSFTEPSYCKLNLSTTHVEKLSKPQINHRSSELTDRTDAKILMRQAYLYLGGSSSFPKNPILAFQAAERAASSKTNETLFFFAFFCAAGLGGPQDPQRAFKLIKEASLNDQTGYSFYILGHMYQTGFGVQRNYLLADHMYFVAYNYGFIPIMKLAYPDFSLIFPFEWSYLNQFI